MRPECNAARRISLFNNAKNNIHYIHHGGSFLKYYTRASRYSPARPRLMQSAHEPRALPGSVLLIGMSATIGLTITVSTAVLPWGRSLTQSKARRTRIYAE